MGACSDLGWGVQRIASGKENKPPLPTRSDQEFLRLIGYANEADSSEGKRMWWIHPLDQRGFVFYSGGPERPTDSEKQMTGVC